MADPTPAPPLTPAARRLLWLIANRPGFLGLNRPIDDDPPFVYGQAIEDDDNPLSDADLRLFHAAGATLADVEMIAAYRQWEIDQLAAKLDQPLADW